MYVERLELCVEACMPEGGSPSPDVDHHEGQRPAEELDVDERSQPRQDRGTKQQKPDEIAGSTSEFSFLKQPAISHLR